MIRILSNRPSDSAIALRDAVRAKGVGCRRNRLDMTLITAPISGDLLINWGCGSSGHRAISGRVLNNFNSVQNAVNKRNAFITMLQQGVSVPDFITNPHRAAAISFLRGNNYDKIYCRTSLTGNSGHGIVIATNPSEIVEAPLYVQGIDTRHEFRFHVMGDTIIDGVRKAFSSDVPPEERDRSIMNHAAGTIFVRSGPALEAASQNQAMLDDCVEAVRALGLSFGAVDVVVDREGQHYVLEVNTAPGLEGTTLDRYAEGFIAVHNNTRVTPWDFNSFNNSQLTLTQPTELTQQEITPMNIQNAVVGSEVTFNPENGRIQTLTQGSQYTIERVGVECIYITNDRGTVKAYRAGHFNAGTQVDNQAGTIAPNEDGSINTDENYDSPLRVVQLQDGTAVNVTGTATHNNNVHTIVDMWLRQSNGDVYLGYHNSEGDTVRYLSTNFHDGVVAVSGVTAPVITDSLVTNQSIDSQTLLMDDLVQVRNGAGGHDVPVGTLGKVIGLHRDCVEVEFQRRADPVRILGSRVGKVTQSIWDRIVAEEEALQLQATTTFTVGSHTYRVADRDMDLLNQTLRTFTV